MVVGCELCEAGEVVGAQVRSLGGLVRLAGGGRRWD